MNRADVVVIGGGQAGLAAAHGIKDLLGRQPGPRWPPGLQAAAGTARSLPMAARTDGSTR